MMSKRELIFKTSLTIALVLIGISTVMAIVVNQNWLILLFAAIIGMVITTVWIS